MDDDGYNDVGVKPNRGALHIAPLLLRLALGVIFINAGLGKFLSSVPLGGDFAQTAREMGIKPVAPKSGEGDRDEGALTEPMPVRGVYALAVSLHLAGNPKPDAEGKRPMRLWPKALSGQTMAKVQGFAVSIVELLAGVFLIVGLLTRLSSLGLVVVMLGAVWLTQTGPAIRDGTAVFGFLPGHEAFSAAWQTPMLQLACLAMAAAVMFSGPGLISVDTAIFKRRRRADDEDE